MFNIPTVNIKATGENIIRLRKQAGLSVKDIQAVCGFSTPQAIYKWQQGIALPTVDNLVVLSTLFGVSIDEILVLDCCWIVSASPRRTDGSMKAARCLSTSLLRQ